MSQIKEEIERWLKNHPQTPFTLNGKDESGGYDFTLEPNVLSWKLYVDDETGKPVQILCETDNPDLQTWAMLLNMHIADNPQRGVTDLLGRAEGALEPKYRPSPTANAPANGAEKATTGEVVEEQKGANPDDMEQEGEEKKSEGGANAVKSDISRWKKDNALDINLNLLAVHEDKLQAEATIGPEYYPFQIHFNAEWKPMFILSDASEMQAYVTSVNELLDQRAKDDPMTVADMLDMLALEFTSATRSARTSSPSFPTMITPYDRLKTRREEAENKAPQKDPTLLDWEEVIIPELRRFLYRTNAAHYEIEEWVRRVRAQMMLGNEKALLFVAKEILGGNRPSSKILPYFPLHLRERNYSLYRQSEPQEAGLLTSEGTNEATEKLREEWEMMKMLNEQNSQFTAGPSANDLYHWNIRLKNFDYDSDLGQDLTEYTLMVDPMAVSTAESGDVRVQQAEILIEMKFPPNYPETAPQFRLVRPGLRMLKPISSLNVGHGISVEDSVPCPDGEDVAEAASSSSTSITPSSDSMDEVNPLSFSMQIEDASKKGWNPNMSVFDMIIAIRESLAKSGARVDMTTATAGYGLPTVNSFWRKYTARSPASFNRPEVEQGGKIILPVSAIEELTRELDTQSDSLGFEGGPAYLRQSDSQKKESTIIFEVTGAEKRRLFCGVLEFTAEPGQVCLPKWVMDQLGIAEGQSVQLRRVNLPKGTDVKVQPHSAEFHNSQDNPKAMLEWVLPDYVALTAGETLVLTYNDKKYSLEILEVAPGRAVSLIDTNINLDFAPPLIGEIKPVASTTTPAEEEKKEAQPGATVGDLDVTELKEGVDYKVCGNCLKAVSAQSFAMHEARCARINWRCDKCGAVVPTAQRQEHLQTAHAPTKCDQCEEEVEAYLLAKHKEEECKQRLVSCEYCELKMPYISVFQHQMKCGEITEVCPECKQRVRRKDLVAHPTVCPALNRPAPAPVSSSFNLGSYAMRRSPSVFVCQKCSTGCDSIDDLQVHMLTVHHGEPEADNMLEETPSQSEKPLDVVEPPRDLKKCSASNCDKYETDQVKFKLCAPCKDVGKKVPYCSRSCQAYDWTQGHVSVCGKPEEQPTPPEAARSGETNSASAMDLEREQSQG